ncbi:cholinephosphotransferase 1-like [Babylonia areolata]|uniref:cholinephosphotransferase 1-like n=1 Tax=Babylonia areolata TaxID=304850 RepID=UPI003FD6187D
MKTSDKTMGLQSSVTKILSESQLKRLSEHKYNAGGVSILEPLLQPFWRWLVEQIPLWIAPNLLTIAGLVMNVVSTLFLIYYSPDAKSELPAWTLLLAALGLFLYQSLDAIDGKQARRTQTSSALGELFDHGCDSVSMVFVTLGATIAINLGNAPYWLLFENFGALFVFYCAHWQTYLSGMLKFGKLDVTEGQLTVISAYILTAIFGSQMWQVPVPVLGVELRTLPMIFSIVGFLIQLRFNFSIIFLEGGSGKNKSTVAGTSTIFPVFPVALVMGVGVMVAVQSPSQLLENHPCLYLLAFGMLLVKIINRLVVAHMTKSEMDFWDPSMIGPALLVVNQYFDCVVSEYLVLWLAMIFMTVDVCWYSYLVCQEICSYLGIYCFIITSKPHKSKAPPSEGASPFMPHRSK